MKRLCSVLLIITLLFTSVNVSFASGKDPNTIYTGSGYGYYIGNPNDDSVIVICVGEGQADRNAMWQYVHDDWSDRNVIWFDPKYNGKVTYKCTDAQLTSFADQQYDTMLSIFPTTTNVAIVGYSAGGYDVPFLYEQASEKKLEVTGIAVLDGYPGNNTGAQKHFTSMMSDAADKGISRTIVASNGNTIGKRTHKWMTKNKSALESSGVILVDLNSGNHGTVCVDPRTRAVMNEVSFEWESAVPEQEGPNGVKRSELSSVHYTVAGDPVYDPSTKEFVVTYACLKDKEIVTVTRRIPEKNVDGIKGLDPNSDQCLSRVRDLAINWGIREDLYTAGHEVSVNDLIESWQDGALTADDLKDPTVSRGIASAYAICTEEQRPYLKEMLLSTSDNKTGLRVVAIGDNQYLMDGYDFVMTESAVAGVLDRKYLQGVSVSQATMEELDQIWSLGLYDNLSDASRTAFKKRVKELNPDSSSYRFSNGRSLTLPGGEYKSMPTNIFYNVVNGLSLKDLTLWKSNGTYDGLTGEQQAIVDARMAAIDARQAKAAPATVVTQFFSAIASAITGMFSLINNPTETIVETTNSAADYLKQKKAESKAQKEKESAGQTTGSTTEKEYSISLGGKTRKVTASSFSEAVEKVQLLDAQDRDRRVAEEDAQFATDSAFYNNMISGINSIAQTASSVVRQRTGTSSLSSSVVSVVTAVVTAVTVVASVVVEAAKAISGLFK